MDNRRTIEIVIALLCSGGCAVIFYGIGFWMSRQHHPVNFWAGSQLDPETVRDIPAYNHANAAMWKRYSVMWLAASPFAVLGVRFPWANVVFLLLITLAGTAGLYWLIRCYRRIANAYIIADSP